jgi:hypothetical protein
LPIQLLNVVQNVWDESCGPSLCSSLFVFAFKALFTAVLPITTIWVTPTLGQVSVCSSSFTSNMSGTNNTEEAAQVPWRGDDGNVIQQLDQEGAGASISQATPPDQEVYLQFNLPCIVFCNFRMLCPCLRSFVVVQLLFSCSF